MLKGNGNLTYSGHMTQQKDIACMRERDREREKGF
jgi:hypothetical protein